MMPREQSRLWTQLTLAALPGAVPCMRLHARQVAWEWGFGELAEIVELLVSELVTNAVKAAQETGRRSWPSGPKKDVPCVGFRLSAGQECLLVEVWDANHRPPAPVTAPDIEGEGGRGLLLVETLSERWGYYFPAQPPEPAVRLPRERWRPAAAPVSPPGQNGTGKVVWCEIALRTSSEVLAASSEKSVSRKGI
jgi:anti-sigma regulatory factor (Ser/Thr protein kinase)